MPRRIAILPDAVADQIAAGEVVERPASVVKELAENAIDAGARHVRIEIESGGKTLVEISDDGWGMGREDAILALDRHATSKIRSAADLVGVRTFGFRGEALPAIASVSRMTLTTAEAEGEGTEIGIAGGRIDRVATVARQPGTTVSVRGLFFNTPARRKFLRSVASELRATHDTVVTLALAHPDAGFEFIADQQLRLHVPAGQDLATRLAEVWGADLAGTLVTVNYAVGAFRITGFIQRPADARPTGRRTALFINGRPFKDAFLLRAAEAGYRSAIHPGDRPSLYFNIDVANEDVDVNVHPAKLEVRFRDRIGVERVVEEAVRDALGRTAAAASVGAWRPLPQAPGFVPEQRSGIDGLDLLGETWPTAVSNAAPPETAPASAPPERREVVSSETPLMQLFNTYIVYEAPEGLVIVDQHSAHERTLYEEVMTRLTGPGIPAQRLLLPLTVDLTDEEIDAVESHGESLRQVGYEVEPFGGRTVVVHTVPNPHPRFDAGRCFREMVADLARGRFGGWANAVERFAATWACRAAIKGGEPLGDQEMRVLLGRLFATTLPAHDVHGRATIVQLPREELERRFGRR
ncbi:MAG: DNA mismatch repair endonuclease MutL [Gemmatimonadota bacterium]